MKTTKYSNYNSNQQVLTELLGQLMRTGNSSNGYSGGGGGGGGRPRSSIRRTASRPRRRPGARPQSIASPANSSTKPASSQPAKRSGTDSSANTTASTAQKRNATESGAGPEKKKPASDETKTGGDSKEKKASEEQDPYLRGLCEDGVRWYYRYLKEGLDNKAACKKAWEQRTEPADYEPQWGKEFVIREIEEETKNRHRLRRRAARKPEIDEDHRIAVHPKEFPDQMLDLATLVQLEEAITAEIAKGADVKLQFGYAHLRPGALLVDCVNEETVNWLKDIVTKLPDWVGPALTASQERVIPDAYVMTVALPKSVGQEFERTLALISAQNEELNTEVWKFVNEREENEKQVVTIRVDKDSFNTMKRNDWKLYYRFEKVSVHFHRYLRFGKPIMWITNPSCHKLNQVKPPGPANAV